MAGQRRVLIAGESWVTHAIHQKGFDSFTTTDYTEGVRWLRAALERSGYAVDFLPNHSVPREFPLTVEALTPYCAVILSDVGANSLLLHPETFNNSVPRPDRLKVLQAYVAQGGALAMIGGYLSFQGIERKAAYRGTPIEQLLPVTLLEGDDRVEVTAAVRPRTLQRQHPIVKDLPEYWPGLLGYNRVLPKAEAEVLVECNGDPLLVVGQFGRGRVLAFTSDCGPHWAPRSFVEWQGYTVLWDAALAWLSGEARDGENAALGERQELARLEAGLERAQRRTMACMRELQTQLRTGMSEREVRDLAEHLLREHGSSGPWCPTLVAFGEGTRYCDPAHPPTDRLLQAEDIVMIDLTPVFDGFYGDYSETIAWGGGGPYRPLIEAAKTVERATLAHAAYVSTPHELFSFCAEEIARLGYRLLDPLANIGHSIGQLAFLEGFVEPNNVRGLRGGWTIEPFIGDDRAGAKFEDILFFGWDGVKVLGDGLNR